MKRLIVIFIVMSSSLFGVTKTNAQVAVGVQIGIAPPEIPVYTQPPCPVEGYLWTPGYWGYGGAGYYWVPGVWISPPQVGFLWTPGYWGFVGGFYRWNAGYWGPHVGYYGGINYGFGYGGTGFYGGRWDGGAFRYNTAIWRVGSGFHNTYVDRTVINNNVNRSSFNGRGGVMAEPSPAERSAMAENHVAATSAQRNHAYSANATRGQHVANGGHPTATARSTVGGQRYNATGNAIHSAARSGGQRSAAPRAAARSGGGGGRSGGGGGRR